MSGTCPPIVGGGGIEVWRASAHQFLAILWSAVLTIIIFLVLSRECGNESRDSPGAFAHAFSLRNDLPSKKEGKSAE